MVYHGLPVEIEYCKKERTPKIRCFDVNNERIRCVVTPSTTQDEILKFLENNWFRVVRSNSGKLRVRNPYVAKRHASNVVSEVSPTAVKSKPLTAVAGYSRINTKSVGKTYDNYRPPRNRSKFYDSASEIRPQQHIDLNSAEHYNRRRDYTETPSERAVNVDHGIRLQRHNKIHQSPHVSTILLTNYTGIAINSGQKVIINGRIADRSDIDWREQD